MWIIIAILLILVVCLYPYVARVIARRRMLTRLCRDIRRVGGKVRRLCRFPALSRNCAKVFELLIRVGQTQYAVKLWSPKHKDAELRVDKNGRIFEVRTVGAPLTPHGRHHNRTVRGRSYSVPLTKARFRTPRSVRQVSILLVAPSYRRILRHDGAGWYELGVGDVLFDKLLFTPSEFLALVRREGTAGSSHQTEENGKRESQI